MRHPNVPESLDSWCILHRMFRFDRRSWDAMEGPRRDAIAHDAIELFEALAAGADRDCGLVQLLGHKGDLMLTHYARSFDELPWPKRRSTNLRWRSFGRSYGPARSWAYGDTACIHADLRRVDQSAPNE